MTWFIKSERMKIFILTFGFLGFLLAGIHLVAYLLPKKGRPVHNVKDRTYWAIMAGFIGVLAALFSEIYIAPSSARTFVSWLGMAMVVASAFWTLWARRALGANYSPTAQNLDPDQTLVNHGPYRFVKHPMYIGNVATMAGLYLAFNMTYAWLAMPFFISAVAWRIADENRFLAEKFGGAKTT